MRSFRLFILVLLASYIISSSEGSSIYGVTDPIDIETARNILYQKYGDETYDEDLLELYFLFEEMYPYNGMSCYKFRARDHMDGYWVTACFVIVTPDGNAFELT